MHDPLPQRPEDDCATIRGGTWSIQTLRRKLAGNVTGGLLCYINGIQYQVHGMSMDITEGGTGEAVFDAVLDHGPFVPTIKGAISQPE